MKVATKMKHKYNITGMTCKNCIEKVRGSIEKIDQITGVNVDLANNSVIISMGDHVQTEEIQKALNGVGEYNISMDTDPIINREVEKISLIKDLAPLFVIVTSILIFSFVAVFYFQGDFLFGMRMFMGGFFIIFGLLKIFKLKDFAVAYMDYDLLAKKNKTYALAYPFIEFFLGVAYLVNFMPLIINMVTFIIMIIGALGVFSKLQKGEKIPCACLGTVFKVPMTWVTLVEDLAMALMAGFMIYILLTI